MNYTYDHIDIDELIGKYLAHEADAQEMTMVEDWLNQGADNQKYFDQFKTIFESAASVKTYPQFDTDAAWNKLKSKLNKSEVPIVPLHAKKETSYFTTVWRVAASLLLVVAIGYVLYRITEKPIDIVSIAAVDATVQDTLPDGSSAFLRKGSTISYAYNTRKKIRSVKMDGEAYFEVKHETEKPFLIETGDVIIEDIGTTFNVKAYPESPTVEVFVETGEVAFYTVENPGLRLQAGETGVYHRESKSFARIVQSDTNLLSYKTRVFNFYNSDLGTVVDNLNEVYETKIRLADTALEACRLNVTFKGEPIEVIAEIIAETLSLKVTRIDNEIILDGPGCIQ